MHHSSESQEITLLYFFSWNCIWFLQKEPIKMQNLRHSTFRLSPNLYCNKFVFLKVYKISAKRVQRKYVSWHWRVMQNLKKKKQKTKKKNRFLVSKMRRSWWIWFEHSKVKRIFTSIGPFRAKYITFDLKIYRRVIFQNNEESCKIWRNTYLWVGKWHEKFGKFSPEHLEVS